MKIENKKKNIIIISFVIVCLLLMFINHNYAQTKTTSKILEITNSDDINIGDSVALQIKVNQIEYTNYKVILSCNQSYIAIPKLDNTWIDTSNIKLNSSSGSLEITDIPGNVNSLKVIYTITDQIQVGTKVNITVSVVNLDDETQKYLEQIEFEIKEEQEKEEDEQNNIDQNNQVNEAANTSNNSNLGDNTNVSKDTNNMSNQSNSQISGQSGQLSTSRQSSGGMSISSSSSTYKGESNNYLSSLSISGYELSTSFDRTNQTYFVEVPNDQSNLTVNVTKDSTKATVNIFGNTNLQVGENKIIVSVKSESGETRNYRIYVTRKDS